MIHVYLMLLQMTLFQILLIMVGPPLLISKKVVMKKNSRELKKEMALILLINLMKHILIQVKVANGLLKLDCQSISLMSPTLIQNRVLIGHQKTSEHSSQILKNSLI